MKWWRNMLLLFVFMAVSVGCGMNLIDKGDHSLVEADERKEGEENLMERKGLRKIEGEKPLLNGGELKKKHTDEKGDFQIFRPNLTVQKEAGTLTMVFTLENISKHSQTLTFSSGQKYDFTILNEKNERLYQWSEGKMFTMAFEFITLEPGETLSFKESWDFTDQQGNKVNEKGIFRVQFRVTGAVEGKTIGVSDELSAAVTVDTREKKN